MALTSKRFTAVSQTALARHKNDIAAHVPVFAAALSATLVRGLTKLLYILVQKSMIARRTQNTRGGSVHQTLLNVVPGSTEIMVIGSTDPPSRTISLYVHWKLRNRAPERDNVLMHAAMRLDDQNRMHVIHLMVPPQFDEDAAVPKALDLAIARYNNKPVAVPA